MQIYEILSRVNYNDWNFNSLLFKRRIKFQIIFSIIELSALRNYMFLTEKLGFLLLMFLNLLIPSTVTETNTRYHLMDIYWILMLNRLLKFHTFHLKLKVLKNKEKFYWSKVKWMHIKNLCLATLKIIYLRKHIMIFKIFLYKF